MSELLYTILKAPLEEFWEALSDLREIKPIYIILTSPVLLVFITLVIFSTIVMFFTTIVGYFLSFIYTNKNAKRKEYAD